MPYVNVKVIEGVLSRAQKKELLEKVTDAVTSVYGEGIRDLIYVLYEEVKSGEWAIAGQPVKTADVRARIKGTSAKRSRRSRARATGP